MHYTDLHNHILPGLDDGPTEAEEAAELALALEDLGFRTLHPTPHQKAKLSGHQKPATTAGKTQQKLPSRASGFIQNRATRISWQRIMINMAICEKGT